MIRLQNIHEGKQSLVFFGGPSVIANALALQDINTCEYTVFLESKALTPYFLKSGLAAEYYLMFYPEKCKSNAFQHVVFQSLLADIDLTPLLKDEFLVEYQSIVENFDHYFEPWRPHKGPHKRFRYKDGIFFKNSPFDFLRQRPDMKILTRASAFASYQDSFDYPNARYAFELAPAGQEFDFEDYFSPEVQNGNVMVKDYSFLNSAAIALFPLLKFMGFRKVFFLGMDMSMLGSMEYSAFYTFKSMKHYQKFFRKARRVFSAVFKENRRKFMRPPYEFKALAQILAYPKMEFVNIFEPFEYALPVKGIPNISFEEFIHGKTE